MEADSVFRGATGSRRLTVLIQDGERTTYRGWHEPGIAQPLLAVVPATQQPPRAVLERLEHEYELGDELDGTWALRPRALLRDGARTVLLLDDPGGVPLENLLVAPMEVGQFLRLAVGVTVALGQVHRRGLVHRDIKPANIVVLRDGQEFRLTGFGIASRLPRERRSPEPPEAITGTLAYMAPEQTGRMNRSIDSRSDLYALGVTLYRALTGTLPFDAADAMEWIHCHIARNATPPSARNAAVPAAVSAIVMKLLAKAAEERYQTAAGLEHDLRRCLSQWQARGRIDEFALGEQDTSGRLLIPERPYGRQREIATLLETFERVAASGTPELVLVCGYSGIGKSTVVNELHKALVPSHGLFAAGKFERYKRDIPFATLAQSFQGLVRTLLAKNEVELGAWREAIARALGPNGALVCELVPELRHIVGATPPVPPLPPQEAQARMHLVLRRLIGVFARPEHPLVLFLDDLQWLDTATLDLLSHLVTHPDVGHLMLIGAYRDNEVDATHPLRRELQAIRGSGTTVHEIRMEPLRAEHLERLIADSLHCEAEQAAPLAELIRDKTGGNPFFAIQFLQALVEDNLLRFDHNLARWSWDLARIHTRRYTDNVIDLMVTRLDRLPAETHQMMLQLACLGNHADTAILCAACGIPEREAHARLLPAVYLGLIAHLDGFYAFAHDRVQEAAYSLIPEEVRPTIHLRLGRLLLAHVTTHQRDERIFDIVSQLNRAAHLMDRRDERDHLAQLNLAAGRRARASSAYASALTYLATGTELLGADGWQRHTDLAFELELNRAECEFITGDRSAADQRLASLSRRALKLTDRAAVACLRINLQTTLDASAQSIRIGLEFLQSVGIAWSAHPADDEVKRELDQMWQRLGSRSISALGELPRMTDPDRQATMDVLTTLLPPALFTDEKLLCLIVGRMANVSIDHGNCDGSCLSYIWLGLLLGPRFGDYASAFQFGQLGFDLVANAGLDRFRARVYLDYSHVVNPWKEHASRGPGLVRQALDAAISIGDLNFAAYSSCNLVSALLAASTPLDVVQQEAERQLDFARNLGFGLVVDIIAGQLHFIRALRAEAHVSPRELERRLDEDPGLRVAIGWYWVRRLQGHVFSGDARAAANALLQVEPHLWTMPSHLEVAEFHFYAALARAAIHDDASEAERPSLLESLRAHHTQLETWQQNCPANFEARAALVAAEIARIERQELDAERLYERAIQAAAKNGFVHDEAIANEVAARFYAARGFERIARAYRLDARHCYARWGATGKVRQLDELEPPPGRPSPAASGGAGSIVSPVEQLDLATVLEVSQAVAGEREMERLLVTLMRTAVEQAGAERALLMLPRGDELTVEAEATTAGNTIEVRLRDAGLVGTALPQSIVNYVVRTGETVVLDDASAEEPFLQDPYVQARKSRSILCLPLTHRPGLPAVLFLENNLAPGAFTPARAATLKLLASLATISLENARLDAERQEMQEQWRAAFESNPTMYFIVDPNGAIVSVNAFGAQELGYDASELIGRSVFDVFHVNDREAVRNHAESCFAELGRAVRWEARKYRKDGAMLWVRETARAVLLKKRPVLLVVCEDITQRKQAEEALRTSEERFRTLVQFSFDAYWESDAEHRFTRQEFAEGFTDAPALGSELGKRRWDMPYLEPDEEAWRKHRETLDAHRPFRDFEYTRATPDGGKRYASASGLPVFDDSGRFTGYRGVGRSITERKRAEQALRDSEKELRDVIETIPAIAWTTLPDGSNVFVSKRWIEYTGLSAQETAGAGWQIVLHADDLEGHQAKWGASLANGQPFENEARFRRGADGQYRWFLARAVPLRDERGNVVKWYGIATDIQDRKQAEQERKLADEERAAHLWFLESMDRVHRAMQGSNDLEQMLSDVLDAALEIFACDRAWLIYPCDPEAPSWRPVMEHTRPEFPGAFVAGADLPIDAEVASAFQSARASSGAVLFGPTYDLQLPARVAERFSIRSQIAMVLYPKVDKPYLFGLHQCSHARVWTAQEQRLFEEIGWRLADSLTSLLMFRSLRESERKLEEAQTIAHVGHWERDFNTGRVVVSDEWRRIFSPELPERTTDLGQFQEMWLGMIHPEDRARVAQAYAAALEGGPRFDVEYRKVRPNGQVRSVHSRADVMRGESGRPERMFGMSQDITDLRQAEEGLRASESRFRTFVDHATDAFMLHDGDGRVVDVNRQTCESLGYSRDELIGMTAADFDADAGPAMRQSVREHLDTGETFSFETRHRRKDGTVFPVEVRVRSFSDGGRAFHISLSRDITERREAEAARSRLEDELRRSQKMEAIGTLAGGIAHDFNNILGAILGFSELSQRKVREGGAIDDELEQVMQAGDRGKRLVEHILAFSRSGAGQRVAVHVQSVISEALAMLAASLPPGVRLQHTLSAGDAAVVGDATQLHQVAMNLCTNAIQAMPRGGVLSVTLEREEVAEQRTLSHGVLQPGGYVRLAVSDTGSGIPTAALERMFDPFFTTKGVGKGTGLGLSLVHGIVAESRGAIDVATREGAGTTFSVWLPSSGETALPLAEDSAELPQGHGEAVMIVDDERALVRLAEETLAQLGYDAAGFDSSVEALQAFREEPQRYDVVLTDQTMPELTGTELASEIRRLRPELPIVLMSGYKGPQLTELAQAAGIGEILHKPLLSRDIAEALARALRLAPDGVPPQQ